MRYLPSKLSYDLYVDICSSPHAYSAAPVRGRKACSNLPGGVRGSGTTSRRTCASPSGLVESHAVFPLMAQLERELRNCRREAYLYMKRHNALWLQKVLRRTCARRMRGRRRAGAWRWEGAGCGRGRG